jgi:hypothetical protein
MRQVYANEIMRNYEEARVLVGMPRPRLAYSDGYVRGLVQPVRLRELEKMTRTLLARVHEKEIDNGENE